MKIGEENPLVNLLDSEENPLNNVQEEIPFEVVLDSGAAEHVSDSVDAPGYAVEASEGSKAGKGFIAANGGRIPNKGQMTLSLKTEGNQKIQSTFQVCGTNRPLWSVAKICDSGCSVTFDAKQAVVTQKATGKQVCSFQRQGGLYVASLMLSKPDGASSFTRQGRR